MRIEMDKIYCGDSLQVLQTLPENAVDCCVTSPPYYALRDYGADGQIGREATPEEYVSRITAVFHEVKRVLTPEGTCWLNIADTYCGTGSKADHQDPKYPKGRNGQQVAFNHRAPGCKPKDLIGIPWLVALALRGDGWYLRSSIIWHKTNPMPESTRDRPTRCYEYVFLLTKSKKYYYDWQAVAEPIAPTTAGRLKSGVSKGNKYNVTVPGQNQPQKINRPREKGAYADELISPVRSRRNVWQINNVGYHGGHFAAFPPKLAETCILAGCPIGGIVLDPFFGSGTTGMAASPLHLALIYSALVNGGNMVEPYIKYDANPMVKYWKKDVISQEKAAEISESLLQEAKSPKGRALAVKTGTAVQKNSVDTALCVLFYADQTEESPLLVAAVAEGTGERGGAGYLEEKIRAVF